MVYSKRLIFILQTSYFYAVEAAKHELLGDSESGNLVCAFILFGVFSYAGGILIFRLCWGFLRGCKTGKNLLTVLSNL